MALWPGERLQGLESSMERLNARIARLAISLGVSLQDEHELANVMSRPPLAAAPIERRGSGGNRAWSGAERRTAHHWEELRGLLILRFQAETRCAQEVGPLATLHVLAQVEERLTRGGFRPDADGLHLKKLLDPILSH